MIISEIKPNMIVRGSIFPEPVKVIAAIPMGDSIKLIGEGMVTGKVHQPILKEDQVAQLEVSSEKEPFDGDPVKFRLGIEALRLGLAYEYDPYFSLSIARVDPLPHQLEEVANLSFQWQRELKDKFRENFQLIRNDVLRATYGANPWQDINQVITENGIFEDPKMKLLCSLLICRCRKNPVPLSQGWTVGSGCWKISWMN